MRQLWILVILGLLFGAFTLNPLFVIELPIGQLRLNDMLISVGFLITVCFVASKQGKKLLSQKHDKLTRLSLLYFGMLFVMTLLSKTELTEMGGNGFVANFRRLMYFGSFFYVLQFLRTENDTRFTIGTLKVYALLGSGLTILQSFAGPTPLFGAVMTMDSDRQSYYNISTWAQPDSIGGGLTRVNLPVIFVIVWAFFFELYDFFTRKKLSTFLFLIPLGFAIFINYARGLLLGVFLSLIFCFLILSKSSAISVSRIIKTVFKNGILLVILIVTISWLFGINVLELALDRVLTASADISDESGTWLFRMNEVRALLSANFTFWNYLFGFGLFPQNSEIGLGYIHFGLADLAYRGGLIFSILLIFYVSKLLSHLWHLSRYATNTRTKQLSASLVMYLVTYIVFFFSANHFWTEYSSAVIGAVLAIIVFVEQQDTQLTPLEGAALNCSNA